MADARLDTNSDYGRLRTGLIFLKSNITLVELSYSFAFAFFSCWMSNVFRNPQIMSYYGGTPLFANLFIISQISTIVTTLFVAIFLNKQCKHFLEKKLSSLVLVLMLCIATVCVSFIGVIPAEPNILVISIGILTGISSGLYALLIADKISKLETNSIIITGALSLFSASLISLVLDLFSSTISLFIVALLPICSLICLKTGNKFLLQKQAISVTHLDKIPESNKHPSSYRSMLARLCIAVFIIGFVCDFSRECCIRISSFQGTASNLFAYEGIATCSALLITIIILSSLVIHPGRHRIEYFFRTIFLLAVLGVLFFAASPWLKSGLVMSYLSHVMSFGCISTLSFIVTYTLCHYSQDNSVRIMGLLRAAWVAGPFIGMQLSANLFTVAQFNQGTLTIIAIPLVLLLLLAFIFILTEESISSTMNRGLKDRRLPFQTRCAILAKRYNLSERETEILTLFGKGRDSAFIQETLFLSKSTVSTHRQHIYQKLNIHSHQELIDLIQDTREKDAS